MRVGKENLTIKKNKCIRKIISDSGRNIADSFDLEEIKKEVLKGNPGAYLLAEECFRSLANEISAAIMDTNHCYTSIIKTMLIADYACYEPRSVHMLIVEGLRMDSNIHIRIAQLEGIGLLTRHKLRKGKPARWSLNYYQIAKLTGQEVIIY